MTNYAFKLFIVLYKVFANPNTVMSTSCALFFLVVEKDGSPEQQQMDTSEPPQDPSKRDSITTDDSRGSPLLLPDEETLHEAVKPPSLPLEGNEDSISSFDKNIDNMSEGSQHSSSHSPTSDSDGSCLKRKPLPSGAEEVSSLSQEASVGVGGDQMSLLAGRGSTTTSSGGGSPATPTPPPPPPLPLPPPAPGVIGGPVEEEEEEPMEEGV